MCTVSFHIQYIYLQVRAIDIKGRYFVDGFVTSLGYIL